MEELKRRISNDKHYVIDDLIKFMTRWFNCELSTSQQEGKAYPAGLNAETAFYARDKWDGVRSDDIFVVSYPKTGTHWMIEILEKMLQLKVPNRKTTQEEFGDFSLFVTYLEVGPVGKYKIFDNFQPLRRVLGTHAAAETFPHDKVKRKGAKIIYMLRNPKDQTVSWYHFTRSLPWTKSFTEIYGSNWNDFIEKYFSGKQPTFVSEGEWYPEHILSWYKYKDQENVKFIYYEDIKKDFKKEVRDIADFIDISLNDDEIDVLVDECSFKYMKDHPGELNEKIHTFRHGKVGEWKDFITVAQSEAIDVEFNEKLANTDINFTYEL